MDRASDRAVTEPEEIPLGGLKLEPTLQPTRPAFGKTGRPVTLWANYFELSVSKEITVFRYRIKFISGKKEDADNDGEAKDKPTGRKLKQAIRLLLSDNPVFATRALDIASNYSDVLFCRHKIPEEEISQPFRLTYRKEFEDEPAANASKHLVKVNYESSYNVGDLMDYVTSSRISAAYRDRDDLVVFLNVLLDDYAKKSMGMKTMGSKSFTLSEDTPSWDLGTGLNALRGFFSSVRLATNRILLNMNVSHAAFYMAGDLENVMRAHGLYNLRRLDGFLKLLKVRTTHLPEKRNKADEVIPRVKTIYALARTSDGSGPHRPRVKSNGAGPRDVEFWLDAAAPASGQSGGKGGTKKKGKGKEPVAGPSVSSGGGRYISVYDFFKQSKLTLSIRDDELC